MDGIGESILFGRYVTEELAEWQKRWSSDSNDNRNHSHIGVIKDDCFFMHVDPSTK